MKTRKWFATPICIVLALLMLVDFTIFNPSPVQALDKKSVLVGAGVGVAAGAGIVLAAPAIAGAIGAAGGIAGIGTAIVGGVAAIGGGLVGVLGAVGGAIAAGFGAVAGWIVGLVASPLFIPALIVIAAVVIGIYLYRKHKKNQAGTSQEVIPGTEDITVTPGDYDMNPVLPPMNPSNPVTIGDADAITIPGTDATIAVAPPTTVTIQPTQPTGTTTTAQPVSIPLGDSLKTAHDKYLAAYQKYTQLVTTGGSGDVKAALTEYQAAYKEYMELKAASGGK